MTVKSLSATGACLALLLLMNTGCFWIEKAGPTLGIFSIPIPVSPYFQDKEEQKFWVGERYQRRRSWARFCLASLAWRSTRRATTK